MSGENVSLREHLESEIKKLREILDERDRLYGSRFEEAKISVNTALIAQKEAVAAAFLASEKAIVKAEDAQREYNIRSNEFRGQLDDQAKTLMPRNETLGLFKGVDDKIDAQQKGFESKLEASKVSSEKVFEAIAKELASLRESRSEGAGKGSGFADGWKILLGALSGAAVIYGFIR